MILWCDQDSNHIYLYSPHITLPSISSLQSETQEEKCKFLYSKEETNGTVMDWKGQV